MRALKYLTGNLSLTEEAKMGWIEHWIKLGFEAHTVGLRVSADRIPLRAAMRWALAEPGLNSYKMD